MNGLNLYHGGLLTSKDISATSGPLIIPSLIGGDLSQIKNNCNRMTSVLSDILNNAIDSMWRKTFQKEKKEIAYGAEDNANRMEEEIEMINQKILRAKKKKKLVQGQLVCRKQNFQQKGIVQLKSVKKQKWKFQKRKS